MYTGEALPNDRESIFWLNILDISAKPKFENKNNLNVNSNYLQLPIHSRIKLFYRPENSHVLSVRPIILLYGILKNKEQRPFFVQIIKVLILLLIIILL